MNCSPARKRLPIGIQTFQKVREDDHYFEFKVVELASSGEALEQIEERGYADNYRTEGLPIHLIGVEFSRELRSVVGFAVETLYV